jgi:3-mercaptopyruvate sulfurtransferase SseA
MGWEAVVIGPGDLSQDESGVPAPPRPDRPAIGGAGITPQALAGSLKSFAILDLSPSPVYRKGHIPGSKFIIRSRIAADLAKLGRDREIVLTSPDGDLAAFALADAAIAAAGVPVRVLLGGTVGWQAAGHALTSDEAAWLSPAEDVYKRPYEGTDNAAGAMQAYIDWELRLVAQLANDGVCNFRVV